jgi:hypothetical protein
VELVVAAATLDIRLAQEALVVVAHQECQVGLLLDEGGVVQPLFDEHLAHGQRQGGVGADADGHEVVGVNG